MEPERWRIADVAAHLGVSPHTVRAYRARNRLPPEDGVMFERPWWWPDTIRAWHTTRPGKGAGAGRKPRSK